MRQKILIALAAMSFLCVASCGGGSGGGDQPASTMTITGKLYTGTVNPVAPSKGVAAKATPAAPIQGYFVNCPPFSADNVSSTSSDSGGSFSTVINASSASFGCYVNDNEMNEVANIVFTNSGNTQSGQIVNATGSVDLGTIVVAEDRGVAQATIPSGSAVTIVDSVTAGAECPQGEWLATGMGRSPSCGEDTEAAIFIHRDSIGRSYASFTAYNVGIYETCSVGSRGNLAMEIVGDNVVNVNFPYEFEVPPECGDITAYLVITTNEACTGGEFTGSIVNCGTCDPVCSGCGTKECPISGTITRQ